MTTVPRFMVPPLIAFWLFSFSITAAAVEDPTERFQLPVSETSSLIRQWLEQAGLVVEQTALSQGRLLISGTAADGQRPSWRIDLAPDSTLGSVATVVVDGDDIDEERVADLVLYLREREGDGRSSGAPASQVIPEPVLNQIANVACIHVRANELSTQFTGFFIDQEGLVLCTAHDLLEHDQVKIMTNTGLFYEGDVVKADFERDLALIKVAAAKEEIVSLLEGRNLLGMGETVYSIGCPINLRGTIEKGFVNGPPRKINRIPLWQVHMKIQPGSSGSPVFDSSGAFVAVVKGRHREAQEIGFLIPLEVVVDFLKDYFAQ